MDTEIKGVQGMVRRVNAAEACRHGESIRDVPVDQVDGALQCVLPPLPEGRRVHSQTGLTACGGYDSDDIKRSCVTLSAGSWTRSHNLNNPRGFHTSWESHQGIMLLGGGIEALSGSYSNTTELLKKDGSSKKFFHLKYHSR